MPMNVYLEEVFGEYGVDTARGVREARKAVAAIIEAEVEATPLPEGEAAIASYGESKAALGRATRIWRKAKAKEAEAKRSYEVAKAVTEKARIERDRIKARHEVNKAQAKKAGAKIGFGVQPEKKAEPANKPSKAATRVLKSFSALCA